MIRKSIQGVLLLSLFSASPLLSQGKSPTFRDMIRLQTPGNVTISSDGNHVAYTLREVDFKESRFRSHIWVIDTRTRISRQYTFGDSSESSPQFSPDSEYLAFLTSRKGEGGSEEGGGRQVWIMPLQGGEPRALTSAADGVDAFRWSSKGDSIFFATDETLDAGEVARRKERRKERFDEVEYLKTQYRVEIWEVDLKGRRQERVFVGMKGLSSFEPSPDDRRFVFASNQTGLRKDSPQTDLWIFDRSSGEVRQLTTRAGAESNPAWSPDGRNILFSASQDPETNSSQTEYFLVPAGGGNPRILTEALDRSPRQVLFVDGGSQLLMEVQQGVYSSLQTLDPQSLQSAPVVEGSSNVGELAYSKGSKQFVFTRETNNTLPEIFIASLDSPAPVKLTDFSAQLEGYRFGRQEVIRWKSKDGLEIEGILNYPANYRQGQKVPLIVNPHGGPHGHYEDVFFGEYQVWASRGYATLSPNFRGSSGYGAAFDVANIQDIGFGDYDDVMTGVDRVIEMGVADPDRMGVHGGSYGGYMTNWIITHTNRFKAAVSKYGIWHILTDFSNSYSPRWEYNYLRVPYWDDWELWKKHSPGSYSQNVTTPVLILHGDADPNTVLSNSREMFTALWLQNKTVEMVIYPREGHGIGGEPNHILDRQQRVLAWWDRYLQQVEDARVGDIVASGDWEMKVLGADVKGNNPDGTRELRVVLEIKQRAGQRADLELDLVQEVYLSTDEDREISPLGIIASTGDNQALLKVSSTTLSRNSLYWVQLVFQVPGDLSSAVFRLKEFPQVRLDF